MRKVWIFLIFLLLSVGFVGLFEWYRWSTLGNDAPEAMNLLKQGRYTEAFEICENLPYLESSCYILAFQLKLSKKETITSDICKGIVNDRPWWSGTGGSIEFYREFCVCMVRSQDRESCQKHVEQLDYQ